MDNTQIELACSCGADIAVSGYDTYAQREAAMFREDHRKWINREEPLDYYEEVLRLREESRRTQAELREWRRLYDGVKSKAVTNDDISIMKHAVANLLGNGCNDSAALLDAIVDRVES